MALVLDIGFLVACAVRFFVPLAILYVGYNVFFHPLSKFPGPFLAKVTNAYGGYHAYRKRLHHQNLADSLTYGRVFRQAPNRLIFTSTAAVQDLLLSPRSVKGTPYVESRITNKEPHFVSVTDKKTHREKRRVVGPVLNNRSMRIFEPRMSDSVNIFLQQLLISSKAGTAANISERCAYLSFDIIGQLAFGHMFNTQTEDTNRFISSTFHTLVWRINTVMQQPLLRIPQFIAIMLDLKAFKKLQLAIRGVLDERLAKEKDEIHDFYSIASKEGNFGPEFFRTKMWPESANFLIAGGTTLTVTMSSVFFYLSRYPDCYARLAEEIRSAFSSGDEIQTGPKLAGCKYLRACIEEALRCHSPVTNVLWRQQDPEDPEGKPLIVDGHVIPRGTHCGISLNALFLQPDIFPDPYIYDPERWLEPADNESESSEKKTAREAMRKAFVPFSAGERICAGTPLAWQELTVTIARTIWYFDFQRAPGDEGSIGEVFVERTDGGEPIPVFETRDNFTAEHDGPYLSFQPCSEVAAVLDELQPALS